MLSLANLVPGKANSKAVKDYGAMVTNHYTSLLADLNKLVAKKDTTVTDTLTTAMQKEVEELKLRSGPAFESLFIQKMIGYHEKEVTALETYAGSGGNDTDLKIFAAKNLLVLRKQLAIANDVREDLP